MLDWLHTNIFYLLKNEIQVLNIIQAKDPMWGHFNDINQVAKDVFCWIHIHIYIIHDVIIVEF